jgi:hypothetical protein
MSKSNYKERFSKASMGLKSSIANLLRDVTKKQGSLRVSINELGKALVKLQEMAKKHHQSFASVVEDAPIGLPRRSAYRYIALLKAAKQSGVSALVEQAGFDPAQERIVKKVKNLGTARVSKMSPAQLAERLEKGSEKSTPLQRLHAAIRKTGIAYIRYAQSKGNELSLSEARREMLDLIGPMIQRASRPHIVAKKAA